MGILGYPNMDDGQDGAFGDYSDIYSNFTEEEAVESSNNAGSDYKDEASEGYVPTDTAQDDIQEQSAPAGPQAGKYQQKGQGNVFVLFLIFLCVAAAGLFYYKKNADVSAQSNDAQTMGDYFYDKTDEAQSGTDKVAQDKPSGQTENMATVDVDLSDVSAPEQKVDSANAEKTVAKVEAAPKKEMTILEKVAAKKKADEEKAKQIGLKTTTSSVVIPVSSGGRLDPFLPYNTRSVSVEKPKFDIVAPPMTIPTEVDPVIDKMLNFKVTGIMFDNVRPSAILTVDGLEQLLHIGDEIMGCCVLNITKDKVVIKYKSNVYEVAAGQSLNLENVHLNPVSSISNQFGGAYSKTSDDVIQFN